MSTQATPPNFKDFGKSANDLLAKDFAIVGNELEVKTLTPNNIAFKLLGVRSSKTNAISADLEGKYNDAKNGLAITQTWTSSNVLKTQVEVDGLVKGLKVEALASLLPATSAKTLLLTAHYKQPSLHTRAVLDVFKGPTFTADAVLGRDGFLFGAESCYSVPTGSITRYALAAGYAAPTYSVTAHALANLSVASVSYYHKVSKDAEVGAKMVYDIKSRGTPGLEFGSKVYLDNTAFVKAKINNAGIVVLGYTQALRPGVKASFGVAIDTTQLQGPSADAAAHKVGTSLVFEA